jgi:hypothetical protein
LEFLADLDQSWVTTRGPARNDKEDETQKRKRGAFVFRLRGKRLSGALGQAHPMTTKAIQKPKIRNQQLI